ncbi:MAG: YfcE family phosphodiesterase [Desulfuromonas sp.]|uniref:metallophosphoesterase family protein n=1 Tax=Desulfuromonas sp. TaxID=892 RepID=UPI000CBD906B|nr:metallophosphoesterase family protein [Desulfuromonas sp.]PLX83365.1 MAG: YfcE family phosphodiesterase [Desulfuromonas sp.]
MIKIGVLSDTHLKDRKEGVAFLARLAERFLADVDMVFHAGDLVDPNVLGAFAPLPVHAVQGNMDPPGYGLPFKKVISVGGARIGLIHGWGAADTLEERVMGEFLGEDLDCLVYGHSHQSTCRRLGSLLLFNPGSPTDRRGAPFHSVGVLEVDQGVSGRILCIDDK